MVKVTFNNNLFTVLAVFTLFSGGLFLNLYSEDLSDGLFTGQAIFSSKYSLHSRTFTNNVIPSGSTWKYLDDGSNQGTAWRGLSFDDSDWKSGNAELGYGDDDETTILSYGSDSNNKFVTTYFRKSFTISDSSIISSIKTYLKRDDGAVVYVNGVEVYRNNIPTGAIYYDTLARRHSDRWNNFVIPKNVLRTGNNVIAVEVHQRSRSSSDISFNLNMVARISSYSNNSNNSNYTNCFGTQPTQSCDVTNGFGTKTATCVSGSWSFKNSICENIICNSNYILQNGVCIYSVIDTPVCTAESCNGLDDDCDGVVDDGLTTSTSCNINSGTTVIGFGTESGTCVGGSWSYSSTCLITSCINGYMLSNNQCVLIDNTPVNISCSGSSSQSCTVGVGACVRTGTQYRTCNTAIGVWSNFGSCSVNAGTPTTESCNGVDDDCDGSVDESLTTTSGCVQLGRCSGSYKTCTSGSYGSCNIMPITESCSNSIDDDCDGTVNDGCTTTTTFTAAQVATHNIISSCWLIMDNKVYNLTNYIPIHPGGATKISSRCGTDATSAFDAVGHSSSAKTKRETYFIGNLI